MAPDLKLAVPDLVRVDQPVAIRASGLDPRRPATLSVRTCVADHEWQSIAAFTPDERGVVEPARMPSDGGTYRGRAPMGLFWSQHCVTSPVVFPSIAEPTTSTITLRQGDAFITRAVTRCALSEVSCFRQLRDGGLVGTLFHPRTRRGRPVLVLGGSEGGQLDMTAAMLANHGYSALALTYFGGGTLPAEVQDVSLDYFHAALDWLIEQPETRGDRVSIYGTSKGGELALRIAADSKIVAGVAAMVPSGVLTAVPRWLPAPGEAIALRAAYPRLDLDEATAIPAERIRGPVLIAAAADDQVWSAGLAEIAAHRLQAEHRDVTYLQLHGAGHLIQPPYLPTTPQLVRYAGGWMTLGGQPGANSRAAVRAWRATLRLLRTA